MMKNMTPYYLSRTAMSLVIALVLYFSGTAALTSALIGGLIFLMFMLAPLSGRYSVHPELGVTALRRDERTQVINDKAGRNAFVISMISLAAVALYYGAAGAVPVPIIALKIVLGIGLLAYYISDLILRKA